MFTGLVTECGRVAEDPRDSGRGGVRLVIELSSELARRLDTGASVSVDGVCLTVTQLDDTGDPARVVVELAPETLRRTNLNRLQTGSRVNLEAALRAGDALGGHWVQGHVDATVEVLERRDHEEHREISFQIPGDLGRYLVEKGSVTLNGVSLTVWGVREDRFEVALIPHTLEITNLAELEPGDSVNLEVDILAKYVEQLVGPYTAAHG